jgi:nicotinate-nucleotide adenylyltransferase
VIGADQLQQFHKWKNYQEILDSVEMIGFNRKNYNVTPLIDMNLIWIKDFEMNISSTEIKRGIARGSQIGHELPHSVWNYIKEHNLYGSNGN